METKQTYAPLPVFNCKNDIALIAVPAEKTFTAEFRKLGYEIIFYTSSKGLPCATVSIKTDRMKYPRIEFRNSFLSRASRADFLIKFLEHRKAYAKGKADQKSAVKAIRSEFQNPYTVGQIFYDSWGYDQTNVDFYQIVEIKNKSVMLQEINALSAGKDRVKPEAGSFIGIPKLRPVQVRINSRQEISYSINGNRGSISPYTAGDNGVYYSSYH